MGAFSSCDSGSQRLERSQKVPSQARKNSSFLGYSSSKFYTRSDFQSLPTQELLRGTLPNETMWPFNAYPEVKASHVKNKTYDYIVVGGEHGYSKKETPARALLI